MILSNKNSATRFDWLSVVLLLQKIGEYGAHHNMGREYWRFGRAISTINSKKSRQ